MKISLFEEPVLGHTAKMIEAEKRARHPTGFKPMTFCSRGGVWSTTVLQPKPQNMELNCQKDCLKKTIIFVKIMRKTNKNFPTPRFFFISTAEATFHFLFIIIGSNDFCCLGFELWRFCWITPESFISKSCLPLWSHCQTLPIPGLFQIVSNISHT